MRRHHSQRLTPPPAMLAGAAEAPDSANGPNAPDGANACDQENMAPPGGALPRTTALHQVAAGLAPDGMVMYDVIAELSELLEAAGAGLADEADGADGADGEDQTQKKTPRNHLSVDFGDGCERLQREIWGERDDLFRQIAKGLSPKSFSELLADAISRATNGKGHGARKLRKLVVLRHFMNYFLDDRDGINRPAVKRMLADRERHDDHALHLLEKKMNANVSYNAIDEYRELFLVKHASRGDLIAAGKKLITFYCANVMVAGPEWVDEDAAQMLRDAAVATLEDEMRAKSNGACAAYRAFTSIESKRLHANGVRPHEAFKRISVKWRTAPENPANSGQPRALSVRDGWKEAAKQAAAAATAAREAREAADLAAAAVAAAADAAVTAAAVQARAEAEERAAAAARAAQAEAAAAAALQAEVAAEAAAAASAAAATIPIENTKESEERWQLVASVMAELGGYTCGGENVRACFIWEIVKDVASHGFGRWGLALLHELAMRCKREGIHEMHLVTRTHDEFTGKEFTFTADARSMFSRLTFKTIHQCKFGEQEPNRPDQIVYGCKPGQIYMVGDVDDVLAAAAGVHLKRGAKLYVEERRCRRGGARDWWERHACKLIDAEHKRNGDGQKAATVIPDANCSRVISIYGMAPRPVTTGEETPAVTAGTAPGGHMHDGMGSGSSGDVGAGGGVGDAGASGGVGDAGAGGGVGDEGNGAQDGEQQGGQGGQGNPHPQQGFDAAAGETVEGDTCGAEDENEPEIDEEFERAQGPAVASWGAGRAREVLKYLLLKRLKGDVILPGGRDRFHRIVRTLKQKYGVKISLDAACIRKARRGKKHWTTLIIQILCQGVEQGQWGRMAVDYMLNKAQSPDNIAKVRMWNAKDDHANVSYPPSCGARVGGSARSGCVGRGRAGLARVC